MIRAKHWRADYCCLEISIVLDKAFANVGCMFGKFIESDTCQYWVEQLVLVIIGHIRVIVIELVICRSGLHNCAIGRGVDFDPSEGTSMIDGINQ